MDIHELNDRLANYHSVLLDLGTGDGRYVHSLAEKDPHVFLIGVDSCRENLREHSRAKLPNMLFVIASAQNLPCELNGLISHLTINFPWGSLLGDLLAGRMEMMCGLSSVLRPGACINVRLNGGALAEAGWSLEAGAERLYENLLHAGWMMEAPVFICDETLQSLPSTWARRLAHGRDPRAMLISGHVG
jgi:16S rRNA (adenine(1408)-N(1))-methyltransferase